MPPHIYKCDIPLSHICKCDPTFTATFINVTLHIDMLCLIYICTHWGNSCSADGWSNIVDKPWRSIHDVHPSCNKEVVLEVVLPLPYMAHLRQWPLAKKAWELSLSPELARPYTSSKLDFSQNFPTAPATQLAACQPDALVAPPPTGIGMPLQW